MVWVFLKGLVMMAPHEQSFFVNDGERSRWDVAHAWEHSESYASLSLGRT